MFSRNLTFKWLISPEVSLHFHGMQFLGSEVNLCSTQFLHCYVPNTNILDLFNLQRLFPLYVAFTNVCMCVSFLFHFLNHEVKSRLIIMLQRKLVGNICVLMTAQGKLTAPSLGTFRSWAKLFIQGGRHPNVGAT